MTHNQQVDLLDYLKTAVVLLDEQFFISFMNAEAESLFKVSGTRVIGEPLSALFTEEGVSLNRLRSATQTLSSYTKRETQVSLSNGKNITIDYAVTPLPTTNELAPGGTIIEVQAVDRLLRISREEDIIASQRNNRDLIRGLAHEIKNPLGGLRGAAQLLTKELPNNDLKDYTKIIIQEADRLRDLVDRMLGPHKPMRKTELNVHEILEYIRSLIVAEVSDEVHIQRDYDPSIPEVLGDKAQLIQALLNIVRNAAQALMEQTSPNDATATICLRSRVLRQFTIGTQRHRLVCAIAITDNGPGISKEMQDKLFLPMVSGRANGTGLGLSIAQSIVNQHNGLIECNSTPENTTFSLYIPLEQQQ